MAKRRKKSKIFKNTKKIPYVLVGILGTNSESKSNWYYSLKDKLYGNDTDDNTNSSDNSIHYAKRPFNFSIENKNNFLVGKIETESNQ